jgi:hypothetical protein
MTPLVRPAPAVRKPLRKTVDAERRSVRNDQRQRVRAQDRSRPPHGTTAVPHACWRERPRPRVTRLPAGWRSESEKARARRLRRKRAARQT